MLRKSIPKDFDLLENLEFSFRTNFVYSNSIFKFLNF